MTKEIRRMGPQPARRDVQQPIRHRHYLPGRDGRFVRPTGRAGVAVEQDNRLERVDHVVDLPTRRVEGLRRIFVGMIEMRMFQPPIGDPSDIAGVNLGPMLPIPPVEARPRCARSVPGDWRRETRRREGAGNGHGTRRGRDHGGCLLRAGPRRLDFGSRHAVCQCGGRLHLGYAARGGLGGRSPADPAFLPALDRVQAPAHGARADLDRLRELAPAHERVDCRAGEPGHFLDLAAAKELSRHLPAPSHWPGPSAASLDTSSGLHPLSRTSLFVSIAALIGSGASSSSRHSCPESHSAASRNSLAPPTMGA